MFRHYRAHLALLFFAFGLCAFGQLERSSIEGTVVDPQGAAIGGAKITVTAQSTNVTSPTTTNQTGYYEVIGLVPGKYTVRIQASGFSVTESRDVEATSGQTIRFDATLRVGTSQQQVEVTAASPLLETSSSNFSTTVSQTTIDDTPVAGRDLLQLVYLLPGVLTSLDLQAATLASIVNMGPFPIQAMRKVPMSPSMEAKAAPTPGIWTAI